MQYIYLKLRGCFWSPSGICGLLIPKPYAPRRAGSNGYEQPNLHMIGAWKWHHVHYARWLMTAWRALRPNSFLKYSITCRLRSHLYHQSFHLSHCSLSLPPFSPSDHTFNRKKSPSILLSTDSTQLCEHRF